MGECGSEKNETKTSICQNQEDLGAAKSCPEQKACEAFTGPSLCPATASSVPLGTSRISSSLSLLTHKNNKKF